MGRRLPEEEREPILATAQVLKVSKQRNRPLSKVGLSRRNQSLVKDKGSVARPPDPIRGSYLVSDPIFLLADKKWRSCLCALQIELNLKKERGEWRRS